MISFILFIALEKSRGELSLNRNVQYLVTLSMVFGTLMIAASSYTSETYSLVISSIGSVAMGLGMVPLLIAWGSIFSTANINQAEIIIPLSILLSMMLTVAVCLLTGWWSVMITASLPIISTTLLRKGHAQINRLIQDQKIDVLYDSFPVKNIWLSNWRIILLLVVFLTARTILRDYTMPGYSEYVSSRFIGIFAIGIIAAAVVTYLFLFNSKKISLIAMLQFVLPLSCASLLFTSIAPSNLLNVGFTMSFIAFINLDVFAWIKSSSLARSGGYSCTEAVGGVRLAVQGGGFIGVILILLLPHLDTQLFMFILTIILIVTAMIAISGATQTDTTAPLQQAPIEISDKELSRDGFPARYSKLGKDYGLSPRELEVFLLLSKGRDVPYIRDELCISRNTVNTHIKHIFGKLNIHSKQELLDLVEELDGT